MLACSTSGTSNHILAESYIMRANPTNTMALVARKGPSPPIGGACIEGAALGVLVGDGLLDGVLDGVLELLPSSLLSPSTVLLLTMLVRAASSVKVAVMLEPLTQAEGVSAVPSTK
jgi:hypothetical protein